MAQSRVQALSLGLGQRDCRNGWVCGFFAGHDLETG